MKQFAEDVKWEDVFYITDLDDGTYEWRKELDENVPHWYNLNVRPNPIRNDSRHYTLACSSNYEAKLRTIAMYVSTYKTPTEFFEALANCSDGSKVGKTMLQLNDDWWDEWGDTEYVTDYDADILEAIEKGLKTTIHYGPNVKVTITEDNDFTIEGIWSEWFETFVDHIMGFGGYKKQEFYEWNEEYCGEDCSKEMLHSLIKNKNCKSIKALKQLDACDWCDILAPLVNDWDMYVEDEETD